MTNSTTNPGANTQDAENSLDAPSTLSEMDQRKNDFLATLAHELRNPLAPVVNGLQLMAFMNLGEDAEKVRCMMARQVGQIVHLVDDLLDIARISTGKVLIDKQLCLVSAVVHAATEESAILIAENQMTLEVIDNCKTACVYGDAKRLTQVVCNLLNNSAKYGKVEGKIVLETSLRDGAVIIRVQDDGIGIPSHQLKDIFRMYSQIENSHKQESSGLGIGLALVRSLVELHGGVVEAHSDGLHCGSTFSVRLPLANVMLEDLAPLNPGLSDWSCSFRVLLVDDLRAMRVVTQKLLEKLGHEVHVAENGKVALQELECFKPDVIISDITMPVMSGHELANRIRRVPEFDGICLVAMTGYGQSSDRERAFEAGFDHHLTKPVEFQKIKELFRELESQREGLVQTKTAAGGIP